MDGFGDDFGDILDSNGNLTVEASKKLKESANTLKSSVSTLNHREHLLKTATNTLKKTDTLKKSARTQKSLSSSISSQASIRHVNYATLNKRLTRSKRNLTKQIHPDRLNLKDIKEKGEKYEQLMIEKHKDMKDVLEKYKQLKEEKRKKLDDKKAEERIAREKEIAKKTKEMKEHSQLAQKIAKNKEIESEQFLNSKMKSLNRKKDQKLFSMLKFFKEQQQKAELRDIEMVHEDSLPPIPQVIEKIDLGVELPLPYEESEEDHEPITAEEIETLPPPMPKRIEKEKEQQEEEILADNEVEEVEFEAPNWIDFDDGMSFVSLADTISNNENNENIINFYESRIAELENEVNEKDKIIFDMKDAIKEDMDYMKKYNGADDEIKRLKELLRKAQLLNSNFLKVDEFLKEIHISSMMRDEEKLTNEKLNNIIKERVLNWMNAEDIMKYVKNNYPNTFEYYLSKLSGRKDKKDDDGENENDTMIPIQILETIKRIIHEPTGISTEDLYEKLERLYYTNEENIKKLKVLKDENEKMTSTIAEIDIYTEEMIQKFKNQIRELEFEIETKSKGITELEDDNNYLVDENRSLEELVNNLIERGKQIEEENNELKDALNDMLNETQTE